MADSNVKVRLGDGSPEKVAYDLMVAVLNAENIGPEQRTRKIILDTYAECLYAAQGFRDWRK